MTASAWHSQSLDPVPLSTLQTQAVLVTYTQQATASVTYGRHIGSAIALATESTSTWAQKS